MRYDVRSTKVELTRRDSLTWLMGTERAFALLVRIFYFAYSHDRPTGGQKQTYRHVDILNHAGVEAYALHMTPGFRLRWIANDTRTIDYGGFKALHDPATDFVVVPEDLGEAMLRFPGRKVVFNQNLFYGCHVYGEQPPYAYPYLSPDVVATLAVSEHNAAALRFACPALPVHRVVNGIDVGRFTCRPLAEKRRLVACIAKAPAQLSVVFHLAQLRARQGLNGLGAFEWVFIKGKTEQEVATILGDALIFVFLGVEEGLALMPLEAMASGCLVLAADAGPVAEYLPTSSRFPVGDAPALITRLEAIVAGYPDGLRALDAEAGALRDAASAYSLDAERRSVLEAWQHIASH